METEIPEVSVRQVTEAGAETQIVDVREPEEWAEGHIAGAVHIPLGDLLQRTAELDPARPVVTVCHLGGRSLMAAGALADIGFQKVASMAGGMAAWEDAGQPVDHSIDGTRH